MRLPRPGVRVKVKFNGQELSGFIMERVAESDAGHTLVPLQKVFPRSPSSRRRSADWRRCRRPVRRNRQ